MAAAEVVVETPSYELLQDAYKLSKSGWVKLRAYPVLSSVLPLAESTTAFALEKAGIDVDSLESAYIAPTLSELDAKYVSKLAEGTKASFKTASEGLGSRAEDLEGYKAAVAAKVDTTKEAVLKTKEAVVDKYDATKDAVIEAYCAAKATVLEAIAKPAADDASAE
uniref:Uncharacterized protein n=1 Tax=Picochlorum oklahomense TaxID=249345 RepID=A0A7S1CWC9_9CHLO